MRCTYLGLPTHMLKKTALEHNEAYRFSTHFVYLKCIEQCDLVLQRCHCTVLLSPYIYLSIYPSSVSVYLYILSIHPSNAPVSRDIELLIEISAISSSSLNTGFAPTQDTFCVERQYLTYRGKQCQTHHSQKGINKQKQTTFVMPFLT